MPLLERDAERAALAAAVSEAWTDGRAVVVVGESGIGKTRLLHSVLDDGPMPVYWGACDPLSTPRPLGPLRDIARESGGELARAIAEESREALLSALLEVLSEPSVLVLEDIHWVDNATLDLIALVGRRLGRIGGALVLTCWPEMLASRGDVRRTLAALPRDALRTIQPAPLSPAAVRTLAEAHGRDGDRIHRLTGGNPFFVSEVLAAPDAEVPTTVRAAVTSRQSSLPAEAQRLLDVVSVIPGPAPLALLGAATGTPPDVIDTCLQAGFLAMRGDDAVAFRHELACQATAQSLGVLHRRELEAAVLAALEQDPDADVTRLAHYARGAGDGRAIRRYCSAAARTAAQLASHRQALEHWEAAFAAGAGREALNGVALESYLCGDIERSLAVRRELLAAAVADGDQLRIGESERWLSRLLWWSGDGALASEYAGRAVTTLEGLPPGRELAMALSARSQLEMLSEQHAAAIATGTRAAALARELDDFETLAHALTNVGTSLLAGPEPERGRSLLREAFALAEQHGNDDHAARALVNLATMTLDLRRDDLRAPADLEAALRFAVERNLGGYAVYLRGARASWRLTRGDWSAAERDALESLAARDQHQGVSLGPALTTLGRLQARRGDPGAARTLGEAWRQAVAAGELQRIAPAMAARIEFAWLGGDAGDVAEDGREALELAVEREHPWAAGELAVWLRRIGIDAACDGVAEPYALSMAGDTAAASAAWARLGVPYEAALAACDSDDEADLIEALRAFDELGASVPALRLRRRLRAGGTLRIPRGPRAPARAHPAGLTPRQAEVLELVCGGATNAEIARRLVLSAKTVDHHVSAVLTKLGAKNRLEAAAMWASRDEAQDGERLPMS